MLTAYFEVIEELGQFLRDVETSSRVCRVIICELYISMESKQEKTTWSLSIAVIASKSLVIKVRSVAGERRQLQMCTLSLSGTGSVHLGTC